MPNGADRIAPVNLQSDGFCLIQGAVDPSTCAELRARLEARLHDDNRAAIGTNRGALVGGRNLLSARDCWAAIFRSPAVTGFVRETLGASAGAVRVLYFDKPPGQSWALPLHRDKTIAVAEHLEDLSPFSKPTVKAGTPHVEASERLLAEMLTLRVHLDAMNESNGPLYVVPGSHHRDEATETRDVHCAMGDVFAMRPLLLHGSRASDPDCDQHRRVLHIEIAKSDSLPGSWNWHQFEALPTASSIQ